MNTNRPANLSRLSQDAQRTLQADIALVQKMLAVASAQTEALRIGDAVRVAALDEEGRSIAEAQSTLGTQRDASLRALAGALGFQVDAEIPLPPLSELALRLPLAEAHKLLTLRSRILSLQQKMEAVTARNRALLENALDYVQFSITALTTLALRPAPYGPNVHAVVTPIFYVDQRV